MRKQPLKRMRIMVFILTGIAMMALGLYRGGLSSDVTGAYSGFAIFNQGQLAAWFGFASQQEPAREIVKAEDLPEKLDKELDAKPELELEPTSPPEPTLEPKPASIIESKSEPKTEPKTKPKTEPQPEPETEPAPQPSVSGLPQAEQQMVDLVNKERTDRGLHPLKVHSELTKAARFKCQDMIDYGFGHTTKTYGSPSDLLKFFNIKWTSRAENIAYNSSVEAAHNGLMNSNKGHKDNILNENYTQIGIGIVQSEKYGLMITQIFIRN